MQENTSLKTASEILGDKWIPQIINMLVKNETVRFRQFYVLGISPRALSVRLEKLKSHDIIIKEDHLYGDYSLTQKGKDLYYIIREMEVWADRYKP
jgi:DNA-binding HxlR family transcriptional regulator